MHRVTVGQLHLDALFLKRCGAVQVDKSPHIDEHASGQLHLLARPPIQGQPARAASAGDHVKSCALKVQHLPGARIGQVDAHPHVAHRHGQTFRQTHQSGTFGLGFEDKPRGHGRSGRADGGAEQPQPLRRRRQAHAASAFAQRHHAPVLALRIAHQTPAAARICGHPQAALAAACRSRQSQAVQRHAHRGEGTGFANGTPLPALLGQVGQLQALARSSGQHDRAAGTAGQRPPVGPSRSLAGDVLPARSIGTGQEQARSPTAQVGLACSRQQLRATGGQR